MQQLSDGNFGEILTGLDSINQSIEILLGTAKGSNPVRPDYGVNLYEFLDAPVSRIGELKNDILQNITAFIPEVEVNSINHVVSQEHVTITVLWTERETGNQTQTIVNV